MCSARSSVIRTSGSRCDLCACPREREAEAARQARRGDRLTPLPPELASSTRACLAGRFSERKRSGRACAIGARACRCFTGASARAGPQARSRRGARYGAERSGAALIWIQRNSATQPDVLRRSRCPRRLMPDSRPPNDLRHPTAERHMGGHPPRYPLRICSLMMSACPQC
jgi:hypothetical protein